LVAGRSFNVGAIVAAVAVVAGRLAGLSVAHSLWLLAIAPLSALLGAAWWRAADLPDLYRLAKQIDGQLGLQDRLAGGYDLLRQERNGKPASETFFGVLVASDALAAVREAQNRYWATASSPQVPLAALSLILAASAASLLLPNRGGVEAPVVSAQNRQQAQALNNSLASIADAIKTLEGVDEQQQEAMFEALRQIQISEDDLKKMSRADIIRRLREASSSIKLPEGAQAAAVRQAMEDKLRAVAEMEQVQKQLAQIGEINARMASIDLGDGRKTSAVNITLESSDLQIDKAIAMAVAKPGESEEEYRNRLRVAEASAKAQREAIKKFLAKAAAEVPPAEVHKLAALIDSDAEFQGKVLEAIKDPSGKKLEDMRAIYHRQLQRELEKENVPRGLRQQLSTYMGPVGEQPAASSQKGATP
jgi:hypothetical protein